MLGVVVLSLCSTLPLACTTTAPKEANIMANRFPTEDMELTRLLVVQDAGRSRLCPVTPDRASGGDFRREGPAHSRKLRRRAQRHVEQIETSTGPAAEKRPRDDGRGYRTEPRAWYENILGAQIEREYGSSVVLKLLGQWLLLVEAGGPTEDKPTVHMVAPENPDRVSAELIFRVPDCQGAYETLKARGAEFLAAPKAWGHSEIRAFFRDPDGHLFEISELRS